LDSEVAVVEANPRLEGLRAWTHVIYALHAWSVLIGLLTPAFVLSAFLLGWPSLVAVVFNYIKRSDATGTLYESHFRWQIRTFWFALLWVLVVSIISAPFVPLVIGLVMIIIGFAIIGVWALYRVARGWMALRDARPLPLPGA